MARHKKVEAVGADELSVVSTEVVSIEGEEFAKAVLSDSSEVLVRL